VALVARADLLLVDGDPTTNIDDTLSVRAVWRPPRHPLIRRARFCQPDCTPVPGYLWRGLLA
jgi:hypothetical protein